MEESKKEKMIRVTNIKRNTGETASQVTQINLAQKIKRLVEKDGLTAKVKVSV